MKKINILFVLFFIVVLSFISCGKNNSMNTDIAFPDDFYTDSENDNNSQIPSDSNHIDNNDDVNGAIDSNIVVDGGIITPNHTTVVFISEFDIKLDDAKIEIGDEYLLPTPKQFNYIFSGWYYDGKLIESSGKWNIENEVVELVAKWEKINENIYNITYDFDGGTDGGKEFPTYYDSALGQKIKINTPVKDGYKFIGWKYGDTVSYAYRIDKKTTGDISLKALWYQYEYTYQDDSGIQYRIKEDNTLSVVGYVGGINDINIPSSYSDLAVTEIGPYAFCGLENQLATVQSFGFVRCNVPDTINKISIGAFTGCDDLKVQFYSESEMSIEDWLLSLTIEKRNDHVLDVINGKRPAIGWKKYVIPE